VFAPLIHHQGKLLEQREQGDSHEQAQWAGGREQIPVVGNAAAVAIQPEQFLPHTEHAQNLLESADGHFGRAELAPAFPTDKGAMCDRQRLHECLGHAIQLELDPSALPQIRAE